MKNPINVKVLKAALADAINTQPYHIQRWVIVAGDGMTSDLSYGFAYSWRGTMADTGKQVFNNFVVMDADISTKNFILILPEEAGKVAPERGDEVRVYHLDGSRETRYRVNFVQTYYAGSGPHANPWKHECHVVRMES